MEKIKCTIERITFQNPENGRIVTNAHKINQGTFPDISNGRTSDFFFIKEENPVPTDWFNTVQTLEGDINRKLDDMYKEEGDKYYKEKRPIS